MCEEYRTALTKQLFPLYCEGITVCEVLLGFVTMGERGRFVHRPLNSGESEKRRTRSEESGIPVLSHVQNVGYIDGENRRTPNCIGRIIARLDSGDKPAGQVRL